MPPRLRKPKRRDVTGSAREETQDVTTVGRGHEDKSASSIGLWLLPNMRFSVGLWLTMLVSLASYWNSLENGFVYDDARGVVSNQDVSTESPFTNVFLNDFWG